MLEDDDNEKEETIYHGTTRGTAHRIVGAGKFRVQCSYFSSEKSLARYFAKRSSDKRPNDGGPAVVAVSLYESDLKQWHREGAVTRLPFDEGDAPELKNKIQLKFDPGGMERLNRLMFRDSLKLD